MQFRFIKYFFISSAIDNRIGKNNVDQEKVVTEESILLVQSNNFNKIHIIKLYESV